LLISPSATTGAANARAVKVVGVNVDQDFGDVTHNEEGKGRGDKTHDGLVGECRSPRHEGIALAPDVAVATIRILGED
jgi:hypothetical protein